jgi:hypothetical protein
MKRTQRGPGLVRTNDQPANRFEDTVVGIVAGFYPIALVSSVILVSGPLGWAWGIVAGLGFWAVAGTILIVCASILCRGKDKCLAGGPDQGSRK